MKEREHRDAPPARNDLQLYEDLGRFVGEVLNPVIKRVQVLEETALTDGGVWRANRHYRAGAVCTDRGALFVAKADNEGSRPGSGPNWRQLHKTIGVK